MSWMRFVVLDVGQGSANFVERYDDADRLTHAALIDVGSEKLKRAAGVPSVQWMAARLQQMVGGPRLQAVVLSHSDADHVNLVPDLLKLFDTPRRIGPTKPVLTIDDVFYGGAFPLYKKGKQRNFLEQLDDYRPLGVEAGDSRYPLCADWTSFEGVDLEEFLPLKWIGNGEIPLWVLTANTTAGYTPVGGNSRKRKREDLADGYSINTRSIVVGVVYGGRSLIATGDATGQTLRRCNSVLEGADAREALHLPALMLTAPHHGSDTTTYDLTGHSHGSAEAHRVVETFAGFVLARTLTASAGERATFEHPAGTVIYDLGQNTGGETYYIDPALVDDDEHFCTIYWRPQTADYVGGTTAKWPTRGGWYSSRTWRNLYTTDYFTAPARNATTPVAYPWMAFRSEEDDFDPDPGAGVAWAYDVHANGTFELKVARTRDQGDPEYWAAVERIHGPLPDDGLVWVPSADRPQPVLRLTDVEGETAPRPPLGGPPRTADRRAPRRRPAPPPPPPAPEPAPAPPRMRRPRQIP